jgi:hypothetical protein
MPKDIKKENSFKVIADVCDEVKGMLIEKHQRYGSSATSPLRIFAKSDTVEQINVRIDDKLSRISRGSDGGEDTELDLIGYLILKRVALRLQGGSK